MTALGVDNQVNGFSQVASLLWQEREILERVLFKLHEEQLVAASGQVRWLGAASSELEAALLDVRRAEVVRAAKVDELAEQRGLPPGIALAQLADAAPEPWDEILLEHRAALRRLAAEIDAATVETRRLLEGGARSVRERLVSLCDAVATYDSRGMPESQGHHTSRVDAQA
jgi:hypothetical protein